MSTYLFISTEAKEQKKKISMSLSWFVVENEAINIYSVGCQWSQKRDDGMYIT